jgi:hypothetical protein
MLGYYIYLPSAFIYHDVKKMEWFPAIDKKYYVSGGWVYQIRKYKNGNYFCKYLCGVAILESPFFFLGHWIAKHTGYEADGFSPPYQYALGFGNVLIFLISLFLLRRILLMYFTDLTVTITLLLLTLATNTIQYVCYDTAMSHCPIFPLYVIVLYSTIKWHQKPSIWWASLTGYVIGLATISRPTEAIMFLIPLLWNTQTRDLAKEKWKLVKKYQNHIYYIVFFAFIGILPQLIYWQYVTGFFIFDVGSSWDFLTPHLRVLFGWEKGWFIYTPITLFFIIGIFFMKKYPFKKAVIYFCLINIYIIISWRNWRYGGSYSTRALVQSYPVFSLAFASLIEQINLKKWRFLFYFLGIYLVYVNLFQIKQYNKGIILCDGMNGPYYRSIYLNNHPTPIDMSLLDTVERISNENKFHKETLIQVDSTITIKTPQDSLLFTKVIHLSERAKGEQSWLKIESEVQVKNGFYSSYLNCNLQAGNSVKHNKIRLFNPLSPEGYKNPYAFYVSIPDSFKNSQLKLYITSKEQFKGTVEKIKIYLLQR